MRIGGFCASMVRICTGEVWVRSTLRSPVRPGREEERVVHLARRMALGEIQRGEIVIVGLDVRTFGDREAHVGEDRGDLVDHLADRMDAAALGRRRADRQRHVDVFGGEPRRRSRPRAARPCGRASASVTRSSAPLIAGPVVWRSSGAMAPSVFSSSETEPFLPSAATRTALDRRLVAGRGDVGHDSGFQRSDVVVIFVNGEIHVVIRPAVERALRAVGSGNRKPAPALPARVSQIEICRKLGKALA